MDFREQFETLDAETRAALVFRYREELPLDHVAHLVGRTPEHVARDIALALAALQGSGALPRSTAESSVAEDELCTWLDKLREDTAHSSFSLVLAVRTRPRQRKALRLPRRAR